jgi:hypothetical protein
MARSMRSELREKSQGDLTWVGGEVSAVERTDTGANYYVRENAPGSERVHHADLSGAKAAGPSKVRSRLHWQVLEGELETELRDGRTFKLRPA